MDFSWTNYPNKPIKELRWEIELLTYFSLKNASLFNNQQVRIETKKNIKLTGVKIPGLNRGYKIAALKLCKIMKGNM